MWKRLILFRPFLPQLSCCWKITLFMSWSFETLLLAVGVHPEDVQQILVCCRDAAVAKLQLLWQPRSVFFTVHKENPALLLLGFVTPLGACFLIFRLFLNWYLWFPALAGYIGIDSCLGIFILVLLVWVKRAAVSIWQPRSLHHRVPGFSGICDPFSCLSAVVAGV